MNLTSRNALTHDCAVPECRRQIAIQYQLCNRCWRLLPHALRTRVRDAVVGSRNDTVSAAEARDAIAKAVAAVQSARAAQPAEGGGL